MINCLANRMRVGFLFTLALAVLATTIFEIRSATTAEALTGSDLKDRCSYYSDPPNPDLTFAEMWSAGLCKGNIAGAVAKAKTSRDSPFCLPDSADTNQLVQLVKKRLDENPQELQEDFYKSIYRALGAAYPCPTPWYWTIFKFIWYGLLGLFVAWLIKRRKAAILKSTGKTSKMQ